MFYPQVVICSIYPESASWYSVPNREVWNSYSDVLSISSRHQVAGRIKMITPFWLYSSGLPHQVENKLDWIAVFHGIYRTKCSKIPPYFEVLSADSSPLLKKVMVSPCPAVRWGCTMYLTITKQSRIVPLSLKSFGVKENHFVSFQYSHIRLWLIYAVYNLYISP